MHFVYAPILKFVGYNLYMQKITIETVLITLERQ